MTARDTYLDSVRPHGAFHGQGRSPARAAVAAAVWCLFVFWFYDTSWKKKEKKKKRKKKVEERNGLVQPGRSMMSYKENGSRGEKNTPAQGQLGV